MNNFAKRMRELAGISENENKKTTKSLIKENHQKSNTSGADIFDHMKSEPRASLVKEFEGEDYELEDRKVGMGMNPEIEDEFETIDFEQTEIEEGEDDFELYNLNENTLIELDFFDDDDENEFNKKNNSSKRG